MVPDSPCEEPRTVRDSPWTVRGAAGGAGVAMPGDEVLEAWSRSKRSRSRTRALLRPAVACAVQLPMMPALATMKPKS